jgi:hypothetical protein
MANLTPGGHPGAGLPLLSDYSAFVRRHRLVIALLTGIGLLGGLAWATTRPASFSATTSIVLVPVPVYVTPATAGLLPPEVSIDTDAQLLQSPRVLSALANALGTDPSEALEHVTVTASPNSHVLHVTVSAASPESAATAADAAAASFVEVRRDALGSLASDQLRQMRLFITGQEELLAREQTRRLVIAGQDDLFAEILELRAGLEELEQARSQPAQVVRNALPATSADHANAEVPITSAAMVGLLGGVLLGVGRDRRGRHDHQFTTREEDDRHAV